MSEKEKNINSILEAVESMNAVDLMDLVKAIELKFGVSAAVQVSAGGAQEVEAGPVKEEKLEFKVIIKDAGSNSINVIKAIRVVVPGIDLKGAKELAAAGAVVKEGVNKEEAEKIKKALVDAGATVDVL